MENVASINQFFLIFYNRRIFQLQKEQLCEQKIKSLHPPHTHQKKGKIFQTLSVILCHSRTLETLKTPYCPRKQEFLCMSISPHTVSPSTLFIPPSHPFLPEGFFQICPKRIISLDGQPIAISLGRVKKAFPVSPDHIMHASASPISTYTNIIYMDISQTQPGLRHPSSLPPGIQ